MAGRHGCTPWARRQPCNYVQESPPVFVAKEPPSFLDIPTEVKCRLDDLENKLLQSYRQNKLFADMLHTYDKRTHKNP
eukprot:51503-Amphidinium_carterae.1